MMLLPRTVTALPLTIFTGSMGLFEVCPLQEVSKTNTLKKTNMFNFTLICLMISQLALG